MDEQRAAWIMEAIEEVDYAFDNYVESCTLTSQAHYLIELSNRMSDLRSWHPRFDGEQGRIVPEDEHVEA